jgi:transposase
LQKSSKQLRKNMPATLAGAREEILLLRPLVFDLQALIEELQKSNQTQAIRIAELESMVFGKKKRKAPPPLGPSGDGGSTHTSTPRGHESYRRSVPPDEAVTDTVERSVSACACGGTLVDVTVHDRYVEDIPLPDLTEGYIAKLVTKFRVERGMCTQCGKPSSGMDLGGQAVTVGPNVRLLVAHLVSVLGMSYAGARGLLLSLYRVQVSDGEIAAILKAKERDWAEPAQQLKADIQASSVVHLDETPWPIQDQGGKGYAWAMSDAHSPKVYFALERSREGRHAQELLGETFTGVRISDDYAPYRSLPGEQQLCWAHLYRAGRDLRYNANLPPSQLPFVTEWYEGFSGIYQDLKRYLAQPVDPVVRALNKDELWTKLQTLSASPVPPDGQPAKLARLKAQIARAGPAKLFTCLTADTPADNNRVERDLRQLVLKRKRAYGSKSEPGASALATVLSVCTTTWRTNPSGYFTDLAAL